MFIAGHLISHILFLLKCLTLCFSLSITCSESYFLVPISIKHMVGTKKSNEAWKPVFTILWTDVMVEIREYVVLTPFIQCSVPSDGWYELQKGTSPCKIVQIISSSSPLESSQKPCTQDTFLMLFHLNLRAEDTWASALQVLQRSRGAVVVKGASPTSPTRGTSPSLCLRFPFGQQPSHVPLRISGVKHYLPVV